MYKKFKEKLQIHFQEVLHIETSAHSIAMGFAIGTFISILPTPFINIWLGMLIVLIYPKLSKFSLFFAILFWNPVIITPVYILVNKLGNLMFGSVNIIKYNVVFLDNVFNFTRRFLIANILVAIVLSSTSYLVMLYFVKYLRRKKQERIQKD